jgi:hypothetical protein
MLNSTFQRGWFMAKSKTSEADLTKITTDIFVRYAEGNLGFADAVRELEHRAGFIPVVAQAMLKAVNKRNIVALRGYAKPKGLPGKTLDVEAARRRTPEI